MSDIKSDRFSIKIDKKLFFLSVGFIVYPVITLPWIIQGMLRYERWAFVMWAVFMGFIGILYPPVGDFYRYTRDFYFYKELDWSEFLMAISLKFNYLLAFLSYFFGKLNLNFDLVRFIYNFVAYLLLGSVFLKLTERNSALSSDRKTRILALVLFIPFSISLFLFRFFFSMILFVYGTYLIIEDKKKRGWLFVVLSVLNHFSFLIFFLALIFQRWGLFKFNRRIIVVLGVCGFFCGGLIVHLVMDYLPTDIVNQFSVYIDGYWAGDFLKDRSIWYKIQQFLGNLVVYCGVGTFILLYPSKPNRLVAWVNSLLLLAVVSSPFVVMYGRFMIVLLYGIKMFLLYSYDNSIMSKRYLHVLFMCMIISNMTELWGVRRQLSISREKQLFCSSSIGILTNHYSEEWIDDNVYESGDFKHD